jgi:hypothetical protein
MIAKQLERPDANRESVARLRESGGPSKSAHRREAEPVRGAAGREVLLKGLNPGLTGEDEAILMYTLCAAKLTGPYRKKLRAVFDAEVIGEQDHAHFMAEMIANLGGEPSAEPALGTAQYLKK